MAGIAGRLAILVLDEGSLATARRVRSALPDARIYGLSGRATGADVAFTDLATTLRQLFTAGVPVVAFCAAGIVIRALAPLLAEPLLAEPFPAEGRTEPPVLAVAGDGSAVAPLLGGLRADDLARTIAAALCVAPAVTASRGVCADPAAAPTAGSALPRGRGRLAIVGLGPGGGGAMTPDAREALAAADDIVGYAFYLRLAGPFVARQRLHPSDNRAEMDRARLALTLAAGGGSVAIVSSGDPGIFAMASAVLDALDQSDDPAWHGVELVVIPGISAAHAAAALAGAPLGHDFCVLSLSDNLKPWAVIERRVASAAAADLVLALYNPASRARPWQFGRAIEIVRRYRAPVTPVVLGHDLGRCGESLRVVPLAELSPADADMRTVVIIGSSTTRAFPRADGGSWVYTPRRCIGPATPVSDLTGRAPKPPPR
ncbi:MAG TPA: precorrin-3B C(17)-methyltransferase [Stellaceae bacterium]|nr:precorrin-3B C(17)-methyltransferase [Stellaceae bacterium]